MLCLFSYLVVVKISIVVLGVKDIQSFIYQYSNKYIKMSKTRRILKKVLIGLLVAGNINALSMRVHKNTEIIVAHEEKVAHVLAHQQGLVDSGTTKVVDKENFKQIKNHVNLEFSDRLDFDYSPNYAGNEENAHSGYEMRHKVDKKVDNSYNHILHKAKEDLLKIFSEKDSINDLTKNGSILYTETIHLDIYPEVSPEGEGSRNEICGENRGKLSAPNIQRDLILALKDHGVAVGKIKVKIHKTKIHYNHDITHSIVKYLNQVNEKYNIGENVDYSKYKHGNEKEVKKFNTLHRWLRINHHATWKQISEKMNPLRGVSFSIQTKIHSTTTYAEIDVYEDFDRSVWSDSQLDPHEFMQTTGAPLGKKGDKPNPWIHIDDVKVKKEAVKHQYQIAKNFDKKYLANIKGIKKKLPRGGNRYTKL